MLNLARNVDATTRKPLFLFLLPGWFLLRLPEARLSGLLLNAPPRTTRWHLRADPTLRTEPTAGETFTVPMP